MLDKLIDKLQTPDFWRGVVYVLSAAGVVTKPEYGETIIAAGLALSGILHVLFHKADATK